VAILPPGDWLGTGWLRTVVAGPVPGPLHERIDLASSVPGDELVGEEAQLLLGEPFLAQERTSVVGQQPGAFNLRRLRLHCLPVPGVGSFLILKRPGCVGRLSSCVLYLVCQMVDLFPMSHLWFLRTD